MNRRSMTRGSSPEDVFAQRRGETPYQIYFEISNIGRNVESSKKRARWKFCFGEEGREHEVTLVHSLMSGKKRTLFNGEMINETQKVAKEWSFAWSFGAHLLRVGINFEEYSLVIDGIPYKSFQRRDPFLAAQLEATKRDSMRSLQADEQRRFDRLGYAASNGQGSRSRTTERRRAGSNSNGGSSRSNSVSRGVSARRAPSRERDSSRSTRRPSESAPTLQRRSSSIERSSLPRGSDGKLGMAARSLSARRQQHSPPNPSGSVDQDRSKSIPRSSQPRATPPAANGDGDGKNPPRGSTATASNAEARAPDILSADPAFLEVRGFDPNVSEATFDPLANRRAAVAAANGASMGPGAGAGGGGWPGTGFGGHGPGFTAGPQGSSEDAAAVLQLGMQLEAMGMNAHGQQQQPPSMFFDQGGYQYDQAGFPVPVSSQGYSHAQQSQEQQQQPSNGGFGQPPQQEFGFGEGNGMVGFSGTYGGQGQGQPPGQHEQHHDHGFVQQGVTSAGEPEENSTGHPTDSKASPDPWDMARSGMVNIDDITDTKNKPMVEVKPFTNDHRPLADLVREAPVKERKPVMIERPEPAPTHMALAIVPVQAPGQQRMGFGQGGYQPQPLGGFAPQPQPPNGNNPFVQLQLTQQGHQTQPILYTRPDDPFYNL